MVFLITYDYVFYWTWLVLMFIRIIANHDVFLKRGDTEMDVYRSWLKPDHLADIMIYCTFRFDMDETDSSKLKTQVYWVNKLHILFAIYSAFIFILFLITYGK